MESLDSDHLNEIALSEIAKDIENLERDNPKSDILVVLKQGLSLDSYKCTLDDNMHRLEGAVVDSYLHNSDYLLDLYHETGKCDSILAQMENVLTQFSVNLSGVSDEIRALQFRSEELSTQLRVQSNSQSKLTDFLNSVIVSPDIITVIFDEEDCGSDRFINAISILSRQIQTHATLPPSLPSVSESAPELTRLKNKANLKIREFLVTKINSLKKQGTNVQMIQKTVLSKSRKLMRFLKGNEPIIFNEIVAHYSSTISKIFSNQFRQYIHSLSKLVLEQVATKSELLGSNLGDSPATIGGAAADLLKLRLGGSVPSLSTPASDLEKFFTLDQRVKLLTELDSDVILVSDQQPTADVPITYYPEHLVRSIAKLLCDTVTSEYLFLLDFFDLHRPQSPSSENDRIEKYFDNIFSKILSFVSDHMVAVKDNYDAGGLLLSMKIVEYFQDVMINRRKIAVLDTFFENLLSQIRTRLKFVIDLNTDSLKRVDGRKLSAETIDVVIRRVEVFLTGVLISDQNRALVSPLVITFENFLRSSVAKKSAIDSEVFMTKNYRQIFLGLRNASSPEVLREWEDKVDGSISVLVERKLTEHFSQLIKLTIEGEKVLGTGNPITTALSEYERCVLNFSGNWKSEIEKLKLGILNVFENRELGSEVFTKTTTQLLLYYTRFLKIVEIRTKDTTCAWVKQIVPTMVIMTEIKQQISSN